MKGRKLHCSFCKKDENQVARLVAGPDVYICDVCVAIATQIIKDDSSTPDPPAVKTSFLKKLLEAVRGLVNGDARLNETRL